MPLLKEALAVLVTSGGIEGVDPSPQTEKALPQVRSDASSRKKKGPGVPVTTICPPGF